MNSQQSTPFVLTLPSKATGRGATVSSLMRNYATPLAGALMLIVGGSGLAMFFHLASSNVKAMHEWLGLGLLTAIVAHLVRNGRALRNLVAAPRTQLLLGVSCLAVAMYLSFAPTDPAGNPVRSTLMAVERTPLSRLAPVFGLEPEAMIARLSEDGISASTEQSITEIARATHEEPSHILGLLANGTEPAIARR